MQTLLRSVVAELDALGGRLPNNTLFTATRIASLSSTPASMEARLLATLMPEHRQEHEICTCCKERQGAVGQQNGAL